MNSSFEILDFQEVYNKFQDKIFKYLFRLTGEWEEAKDLTQEVFIKVNNNLARFEGRSSLSTWIYKIATNVANDRFRSAAFQKFKKQQLTGEFNEEKASDKNVWDGNKELSVEDQIARKEMNECINRYIYDLNENYRTVLVLSEYEDLKNQEIADILGITLDTVKIRIHRARTQLKKRMEKGCNITPDPESGLHCDEK
jgi:RNA polymerase sigma-70 factor (ECF subfamily)